MSKLRLFIENFVVYGLGGIINKVIPLIMVPIVTRIMPDTAFYGISDLSNTVISFGNAVAVMGMYDAMYRLFFEKENEDYKKNVCSTALLFTLVTSFVVFVIMLLAKNFIARYFFADSQYFNLVYIIAIATLVGSTNSIISAPTRMQNKRKVFLIINTVSPIISYMISIPLLLKGHYLIALPLAGAISGVFIELVFGILNYKWFEIKRFDFKLLKQLLIIAIPLFPNFLVYWVFNSSDKLMIANILNVSAAGIYSVGAKLGQASQLIYTAFAGGWQYFAFSTMNDNDQVIINSKVFEYLGVISFTASLFVFAFSYGIYRLLFIGEYIFGYTISPYLFLAPLLQMLFQVACNQFLIIKKTWPNFLILSSGAFINIFLNLYFIPFLGIEGAAIATLFGYIVSDVICLIVLCKMKLMIVSQKFMLVVFLTAGYIIIWRLFFRERMIVSFIMALILACINVYLYQKEISVVFKGAKHDN